MKVIYSKTRREARFSFVLRYIDKCNTDMRKWQFTKEREFDKI